MTHWIILPVMLPAMVAPFIILAARYHMSIQRVATVASMIALIALAAGLVWQASDGTVTIYRLGDWAAPFGIVLVADKLSTMMVLLTAILGLFVALYAIGSKWDERGRHFHALLQFQIMGIMGAFLTGDLFNLLGSTLFLFALAAIYAETGTLNMADLAERAQMVSADETVGLRIAAVLLILVFAVKAALVPLHFWLPSSYAEAPGPVAALFAIMTKVGAYAIIRVYTIIFPPDLEATAGLHTQWLLPAALISLALGMVGVLAAKTLDRLVAFAVIGSMGMVMTAIALFSQEAIAAALYYIIHSTLAAAALFLITDMVRQGRADLRLTAQAPVPGHLLIAGLFMTTAIAMAGLPPLSGFVGKLMILDASYTSPLMPWVWSVILISSLIGIVGFARAGSTLFWKARSIEAETAPKGAPPSALAAIAAGGLIALLIAHTVFAGPIYRYTEGAAAQLFAPEAYIDTVLNTPGKLSPMTEEN